MLYVTIFGSLLYLNGQYVLYFLYSLKPLCLQACDDAQRAIGAKKKSMFGTANLFC